MGVAQVNRTNQLHKRITWKNHRKTGYLLGNIHMGIGEFTGTGYHVDDMQTMQTIKLQLMTSHGSHTK